MATTQTFPCPFCGRRMGVGVELLGRHVRCPHCKQVVLAPPPTGAEPPPTNVLVTPPGSQSPASKSEPKSVDLLEPKFTFQPPRETAESILSEVGDSDDEVFSSQAGSKNKIPLMPDLGAEPSPSGEIPTSEIPTVELVKPVWKGDHPAEPVPATPPIFGSPFAFGPVPDTPPDPISPETPLQITCGETTVKETHQSAALGPRPRAASGGSKLLVFLLAPYAAVVTALAIYGLYFKSDKLDPGHPLSTIPDTFGEFDPASRKKVTQLRFDPDGALPPQLKAGLGQVIEVGQLTIEPIGIEARKLTLIEESRLTVKPRSNETNSEALALRLRIKNTSAELVFCPLDPAFNRKTSTDRIGTSVVIGKQRYYGGPLSWPFPANVRRAYEATQESDSTPLKPGETREFVVCSDADPRLRKAVKESTDTITWRVQVRRGVIEFRGKEVPVTAIIGIEFKKSDVKNLG